MLALELLVLILAYTTLVLTLFLQVICYRRHLETREAIAFTASLLLLITALTISPWLAQANNTGISPFTQLAMILVSLTTPLNVWEERQIRVRRLWKNLWIMLSVALMLVTTVTWWIEVPGLAYVVMAFLAVSVVGSMGLLWLTKPKQRMAYREKTDRLFALAFMLLVPLSLVGSLMLEGQLAGLGLTLPLVFMLLASTKLADDLQRLGLLGPRLEPKEQQFQNYQLSERERQVATLLVQGRSYQQIGEALHISLPTVKTHVSNVYKKCGTSSRSELTARLLS